MNMNSEAETSNTLSQDGNDKFEKFLKELSTTDDSNDDENKPRTTEDAHNKKSNNSNLWWLRNESTSDENQKDVTKPVQSWLKSLATTNPVYDTMIKSSDKSSHRDSSVVQTTNLLKQPKQSEIIILEANRNQLDKERRDLTESVKTADDTSAKTDYSEDFESGISGTNPKNATQNAAEAVESRSENSTLQDHSLKSSVSSRVPVKEKSMLATYVIGTPVRGVSEILKEAEEIEKGISNGNNLIQQDGIGEYPTLMPKENVKTVNNHTIQSSTFDLLALQQLLKEEQRRNMKLQAEIRAQEKEIADKTEKQKCIYEGKLRKLEEENVSLVAKVEELRNKDTTVPYHEPDGQLKDQLHHLRKEFSDQEKLIVNYQRENEKLYLETKSLKEEMKMVKNELLEEKQKLSTDLLTKKKMSYQNTITSESPLKEVSLKVDNAVLQQQKQRSQPRTMESQEPNDDNPLRESEITKLKNKILALENEIRTKNLEGKSVVETVRMKDAEIQALENQVKHLGQLLKLRHPNSIPALALVSDVAEIKDQNRSYNFRSNELLEERIRELEAQLFVAQETDMQSLHLLQKDYEKLKMQYEEKIRQLEEQLQRNSKSSFSRPQNSVTALEKELTNVRERYRKETEKLKSELATLRQEANSKKSADHKNEDHFWAAKVKSLNADLAAKEKQIKGLMETIQSLNSTNNVFLNGKHPITSKPTMKNKDHDVIEFKLRDENKKLIAEMELLSRKVEMLEGRLREELKKTSLIKNQKDSNEKLQQIISTQKEQLHEVQTDLSLAESRITNLTQNLHAYEMLIERLKERIVVLEMDNDQIPNLRAQKEKLTTECKELQEKLLYFEKIQTPEWKHFMNLQRRVQEVEKKYQEKSEELHRLMDTYKIMQPYPPKFQNEKDIGVLALEAEVSKWKCIVDKRNQDVRRFRSEMDEIIRILEELQKQGLNCKCNRGPASNKKR